MVGKAMQTSVQRPARTIFLRPVRSIAATKFLSSQEFIDVRSIVSWFGKTSDLKGDADLSPETSQDDLLAASSFDRRDEVLVVPGIHRCPFDRFLVWKDCLYLGPNIPTETFRLPRREHDRDVENLSGLRECHRVVNDRLPIEVADTEQHLRLVVNQSNHAVVRRQESFLAEFVT